jgi:hypothetical protein
VGIVEPKYKVGDAVKITKCLVTLEVYTKNLGKVGIITKIGDFKGKDAYDVSVTDDSVVHVFWYEEELELVNRSNFIREWE